MVHYRLICTCGHFMEVDLPHRQVDRVSAYTIAMACPDCTGAAESARQRGVSLGVSYQQAWAAQIQQQHLAQFQRLLLDYPVSTQTTLMDAMKVHTEEMGEPGWWIDHAHDTLHAIQSVCQDALFVAVLDVLIQGNPSIAKRRRRRRANSLTKVSSN